MPGSLFLEGEKVELRTIEEEDLEFLRNAINHPQVRKNITSNRPKNLQDEKEFYENVISNKEGTNLLICENKETPAGTISLKLNKKNNRAEIGLWLHPKYHGKGYGTESSKLMINYGFKNLELNRIFARAYDYNKGSQKIWEKLNFQKEGELRNHEYTQNQYVNVYYYGIMQSEWQ